METLGRNRNAVADPAGSNDMSSAEEGFLAERQFLRICVEDPQNPNSSLPTWENPVRLGDERLTGSRRTHLKQHTLEKNDGTVGCPGSEFRGGHSDT